MNAMPNPPEDPGSWLTNADHAWNLFWGVCGAISLVVCGAVAYIIKCVQWADELKAEMKRTQAVTEAYRTATEGALDKYQKSTNATLQRLEENSTRRKSSATDGRAQCRAGSMAYTPSSRRTFAPLTTGSMVC